jgi:hypothetical protein
VTPSGEPFNHARYQSGQLSGHYESFFQRANHPTRPLAFWIRYTLFSPHNRPQDAIGELWAIYFDGETNRHVAAKSELPFEQCAFKTTEFSVQVGDAHLAPGSLQGAASSGGHNITWNLTYQGDEAPVYLFPLRLYETRLPSAKSLVGHPLAVYNGSLTVDGQAIGVTDWVGSQNHNWGRKHTDHYAWGQVAGFDNAPGSFLEVATARLKFGPLWTPPLTLLVLRHNGHDYALNTLGQGLQAKGAFDYFTWRFRTQDNAARIEGTISASRDSFVGLNYYNPPGGSKHCLNSKIAACELKITDKQTGRSEALATAHRAAFEILTDDRGHGVEIRA